MASELDDTELLAVLADDAARPEAIGNAMTSLEKRIKLAASPSTRLGVEDFLRAARLLENRSGIAIVDVRSPGEFAHARIPGAHNVPLLDDAQRAAVGTC